MSDWRDKGEYLRRHPYCERAASVVFEKADGQPIAVCRQCYAALNRNGMRT